jgi:hypothetical protein
MMGLAEIFNLVRLGGEEIKLLLQAAPALKRISQSARPAIAQVQAEAPQLVPVIKKMADGLVRLAQKDEAHERGQAGPPLGPTPPHATAESAVIKKLVGEDARLSADESVLMRRASRAGLREGALTVEEEMGGTFRDTPG